MYEHPIAQQLKERVQIQLKLNGEPQTGVHVWLMLTEIPELTYNEIFMISFSW